MVGAYPGKRGMIAWSALLSMLLIGLCWPTEQLQASGCYQVKTKDEYTVHFLGVDLNIDGTSTWNYTVTWDGTPHSPKHFILQLCPQATVVGATPIQDSVGYDGATGIYGVLWKLDSSFPVNTPVPFSVTLDRQYEQRKINWAVKTTNDVRKSDICGPSKDCNVINPLPIASLICAADGDCDCEVEVSWTNQEPGVHAILVAVDGIVVDILPATATSTTVSLPDHEPHDICVRTVFDPTDFEGQAGCQECNGDVQQLTMQYNGGSPAMVVVKDDDNVIVFSGTLDPGEQFSFTGSGSNGSLGTNTEIFVGGQLNTTIHTSCSQPVGPGLVKGAFLVITGTSTNGGPLCPLPTCNECDGKVNALTLRYDGVSSATITVKDSSGVTVFNGTVNPDQEFSFVGSGANGSLGTNTTVKVNGVVNTTIHTSCSQPIGPGLSFGDFTVTAGSSTNGGALCPMPDCGECSGGVNLLTLQYDGAAPATVVANDGDVLFSGTVAPGGTFTFVGNGSNGKMSNNLELFVNGVLNTAIHVSCSKPIGPGLVKGAFTVVDGTSVNNGTLCPVPSCGECDGKVSELTLEYSGATSLVTVKQKNGATVFSGTVMNGEQFSFTGTDSGSFGSRIKIYLDGILHVEVHTSCSQPIGPGLIFGAFEVIAGASKDGGPLCPLGPVGEEIACDQQINGASACICCTVQCLDVPALPPVDLTCTPDLLGCSLAVSWTNPTTFSFITVSLDGQVIATLPGTATSYSLPGPVLSGTLCLNGETTCNQAFTEVCCLVDCMIPPPPPVTGLICQLLDVCTCDFSLSWTNGAGDYDSIQLTLDGMVVANLPGDATSLVFPLPGPAPHELCLVPVRLGVSGTPTCCTGECPDIPPMSPIGLSCTVGTPPTCDVTVAWTNTSQYQQITVSLNGIVVQTLPGTAQSATVALSGRGDYEICLDGTTICNEPFLQVCCGVSCPFPPPPPTDLICTLLDVCTCEVQLSWNNAANDYASIQVYLNGLLNVTLPGTQQVLNLFLPNSGSFDLCIVAVRNTLQSSPPTCCTVNCPDVPALPPTAVSCTPDLGDCSIDVTWLNGSQYSGIDVLLDGILIQSLTGGATSTSVPGPVLGMHQICLQATTICNDLTGQTCCSVECVFPPPPPVTNLSCTLTDVCTCEVQLSWTNGALDYHAIEITVDGGLVQTLLGTAVSTTINLPGVGPHDICVTPVRNTVHGTQECCMITCPEVGALSPVMLVCDADPLTCEAMLTWNNQSIYTSIDVLLNGVVVLNLPGTAVMASVTLTLPGINSICLQGQTLCSGPFPEVCCETSCNLTPPPVTNLTCLVTDDCTCTVQIDWQNGGVYDSLTVLLGGTPVAGLLGTATTHTLQLPGPGTGNICVVPTVNLVDGPAECCMATCQAIPATAVSNLVCDVTLPPTCEATLSWINTSQYSGIVVKLDGMVVMNLPGNATGTTVVLPAPGSYEICVGGSTICGVALPDTCCTVDCQAFPDPVQLTCTIVDPCTCDVQLSWTNTNPDYDELRVLKGGVLVTTLAGTSTQFTPAALGAGNTAEFCVVAVRAGLESTPSCCTINCPALPQPTPISNLTCTIANAQNCDVQATWSNGGSYSAIRVLVNGSLFTTLPGTATSTVLTSLPFVFGPRQMCFIAVTTCGDTSSEVCCSVMCNQDFRRGDCNIDGIFDLADAIKIMRVLFVNLPVGTCIDACDFNDDSLMDISDMVYLVNYIFLMGDPPLAPFPGCGPDPTPDSLDCQMFDLCP